jgi:S1-C subfamily serine protease
MYRRELALISLTVVLAVVVMIQYINNSGYVIGQQLQQQQKQDPVLSTIINEKRRDNIEQDYHHISAATTTTIPSDTPTNTNKNNNTINFDEYRQSLTDIFKQVENSVVQITSKVSVADPNIIINGNPLESQSTTLGSGFIYDNDGHIVTNNHVVGQANTVDVTFIDGDTYSANVIGIDPYSDLAVLQLDKSAVAGGEKLNPLPLSSSSTLEVGQEIAVIGNPFGLSGSLTHGIISQINRLLPEQDLGFSIPGTIQIDAAINPGNSGGPLLNLAGQVIGVTTAIFSNTGTFSGIGFAIPSNNVQMIVPQLIAYGNYKHPWLGIVGTDITPDVAKEIGLKQARGVLVVSVTAASPADVAGIKVEGTNVINIDGRSSSNLNPHSDVIVGIDNKQIRKMDDIINYIDTKSVGDSVVLKVLRNGTTQNIDVKLTERPNPQQMVIN